MKTCSTSRGFVRRVFVDNNSWIFSSYFSTKKQTLRVLERSASAWRFWRLHTTLSCRSGENYFRIILRYSIFLNNASCRLQWIKRYSWLSLSRPRLSRITAYLEVKIWSLPIHENLTTDGKYCRKEEKLLLRSNFSSFPQYFSIYL